MDSTTERKKSDRYIKAEHICQTCQHHSNNPSYCDWFDRHVLRKEPACTIYKPVGRKIDDFMGRG